MLLGVVGGGGLLFEEEGCLTSFNALGFGAATSIIIFKFTDLA